VEEWKNGMMRKARIIKIEESFTHHSNIPLFQSSNSE
jgi:hypothetical protein